MIKKNYGLNTAFIEKDEFYNEESEDKNEDGNIEDFPSQFDWRNNKNQNFDSPVRKQGQCGSCYAISAISVMESRIRIKTENMQQPRLSVSHTISCSRYNQGCNGGYPYLIGKYAKEFGFVDEVCQAYGHYDMHCKQSCYNEKVYKAKDYGYVGGYYGSCNEKLMMKEIFNNGPIVVAINATPELYYYHSGIFISNARRIEGEYEKKVKPWEYTNHAVVCIGWGEEEFDGKMMKFWILKNSWGPEWGDKGYFKIQRGVDMASVEAQGVFLNPEIEENIY